MFQDVFKRIEKETDIIDWNIDGIYIWRYERFMVHRYFTEKESKANSKVNISREANGKSLIDFAKLYVKYSSKATGKEDLLLLNHSRRAFQDGVYICKYTEEISRHYASTVTYETVFNDKHLEPTNTKNLRYLDRIILQSYLYETCLRKVAYKKYVVVYEEIKNKLENMFGEYATTKDVEYIAKSMTKNLFLIKYRMKKMDKIIKQINPKVIIEVVGYSRNNMIVNEIAKRRGIPTVELQHSQISEQLIQYMWNGRKDIQQFPDYLFTFGEFWSQNLQLPIPKERVVPVGFPYFEEQINETRKKGINNALKSDVVFISQYMAGEAVYKLALHCCKLNSDIQILYKLHPEEYDIWEQRYPKLKAFSNINVVTDTAISLYDCFAATKAVVGVYSGALYEALAFDLPVYLYQDYNYIRNMKKLVDINGARVINGADELISHLQSGTEKKAVFYEQEIWKRHAKENMFREIDKIVSESSK